jgi:hypothetical protein
MTSLSERLSSSFRISNEISSGSKGGETYDSRCS